MNVKIINKILSLILVSCILSACDSFLDTTIEDLRSPDQIFESKISTENALMGVYAFVRESNPFSLPSTYSTMEVIVPYTNVHTFNDGIWDAGSAQYDRWFLYYRGIREATYFIQNVDKCPDLELTDDLREQWKAEARAVRAYLYVELMRMYGPVILLKDELIDINIANLHRPRNTWDECVAWVSEELKELSEHEFLPLQQSGEYYARFSKSVVLAYRSRILLTSASPLFNGNNMYFGLKNPDGTNLFPTKEDISKWALAREAAEEVIDMGIYKLVEVVEEGSINPYKSYRNVFIEQQNKEMIFPFMETNSSLDKGLAPNSINGWGFGWSPTQEMVDMYAMGNGIYPITGYSGSTRLTPVIDPASGYTETGFSNFSNPLEKVTRRTFNMYVDREPRFYASILYGGTTWFVSNNSSDKIFVELFWNGNNGVGASHNHSPSGYGIVKFVMPDYIASSRNVKREIPLMRYAEILLNYIEATIELGKSEPSYLNDAKMFEYWDALRARAGLPPILSVYPDANQNYGKLQQLIRRERQIEMALEGVNFYDNRRWMVALDRESGFFHGMNVEATGNVGVNAYPDAFFARRAIYNKKARVFHPSFYLYPIPQSAVNKNHDLVQNYKW